MTYLSVNAKNNRAEFEKTLIGMRDNSLEFNHLKFSGCISDDIIKIAEALKINTSVTKLDLSGNYIDNKAAGISLAEAIKVNKSLKELNLSLSLSWFTPNLHENTALIVKALMVNTSITKLNLGGNSLGTAPGPTLIAELLKANTFLQELGLRNNRFGDEGTAVIVKALMTNTSITKLDFSNNVIFKISGIGVATLIAQLLKANTFLQELDLSQNIIWDDGIALIAEALMANTSLKKLSLANQCIKNAGAASLGELLKVNTSLKELDLSNNRILIPGAIALSKAIQENPSLEKFNLSNNQICFTGAKAFAKALKLNKSITVLKLASAKIGDKGAKEIAEATMINTSLKELDLSKNGIGNEAAGPIAKAIEINKSITNLSLNSNDFNSAGKTIIAKAISANKLITNSNSNPGNSNFLIRNKNFLQSAKAEFVANQKLYQDIHLSDKQYQVLIANIDDYDSLFREELVGRFLEHLGATSLDGAPSIEIGKFISREELIKFARHDKLVARAYFRDSSFELTTEIVSGIKELLEIAGPLQKTLKLPHNVIFIKDELKNNRPFRELIANFQKIKNDPDAQKFIKNNPKALGGLMGLNEDKLDIMLANKLDTMLTNTKALIKEAQKTDPLQKLKLSAEQIDELLSDDLILNEDISPSLHLATHDTEAIEKALEKDNNINVIDSAGDTILHRIITDATVDVKALNNIIQFIISKGIDINLKNQNCKTALDLANDNYNQAGEEFDRIAIELLLTQQSILASNQMNVDNAIHVSSSSSSAGLKRTAKVAQIDSEEPSPKMHKEGQSANNIANVWKIEAVYDNPLLNIEGLLYKTHMSFGKEATKAIFELGKDKDIKNISEQLSLIAEEDKVGGVEKVIEILFGSRKAADSQAMQMHDDKHTFAESEVMFGNLSNDKEFVEVTPTSDQSDANIAEFFKAIDRNDLGSVKQFDQSLVNATNLDGNSALFTAMIYGHRQIAQHLLSQGAKAHEYNQEQMVTLRTLLLENNLGQNNLDQEAHIALEALDITDYNSMLSYLPHITTTILLGLSMQIESF